MRYGPNGGTGTIADQTVGDDESAYTATDGFTFFGHGLSAWNIEPDGTGDSYKPGDTINIDKPATLYAQWGDIMQAALPATGGTVNDHYLLKETIGGAASSASSSCHLRGDACAEAGSFVRKDGVTC